RAAGAAGAGAIALANKPGPPLFEVARPRILAETGSGGIAGPPRENGGNPQKNGMELLSPARVGETGRLHRGVVGVIRVRTAKVGRRAEVMVSEIIRCPEGDAARYLKQADGDVKTAVLLGLGLGRSEAAQLLQRHGGNLRSAIKASTRGDG